MGRSRRKYTRFDFVFSAVFAFVIIAVEHPFIFYSMASGGLLVGAYFYLLAFKKYNRNFLEVRDHLFIISTIKYWRRRTKLILGIVLFLSITFLADSISNPLLKGIINLAITGLFLYLIVLGFRRIFKIFKSLILNISPTNFIAPIEDVDIMKGFEFEQYLAPLFRDSGYYVEVTKPTGDFGGDLILKRNKEKGVVQAKLYGEGYKVGVEAVNEVVGAAGYYNATKKMVITNRYYTDSAKISAKRNGVSLLDRDDLIRMINQYNENQIRFSKERQLIES